MATAPPNPNLSQFNFADGDTDAAITKDNGRNAAIDTWAAQLTAFGEAIEQEQAETIQEAQAAANTAGEKAVESAQSAAAALQARNEAQAIAVGDLAITDLLPGPLNTVQDYVSVDAQGNLVRRNLVEDVSSYNAGSQSAALTRYDLASISTTATLDLAASNVFRVDASVARTLAFANAPGANRAMTVVVHITGNSSVTWPTGIDWDSGAAPELGDSETKVVLFWDGVKWSGFTRVAK